MPRLPLPNSAFLETDHDNRDAIMGAGFIAMGLTATALALAADEKTLVENGGFEDVREGLPAGWFTV